MTPANAKTESVWSNFILQQKVGRNLWVWLALCEVIHCAVLQRLSPHSYNLAWL